MNKKYYKLFLDDIRSPMSIGLIGEWIIVRNYNDFVKTITENGLPETICFDHDLSYQDQNKTNYKTFKEKTGFHCAEWLVDYCQKKKLLLPDYQVHSMNPVGKENIISLLENFKEYQAKTTVFNKDQ